MATGKNTNMVSLDLLLQSIGVIYQRLPRLGRLSGTCDTEPWFKTDREHSDGLRRPPSEHSGRRVDEDRVRPAVGQGTQEQPDQAIEKDSARKRIGSSYCPLGPYADPFSQAARMGTNGGLPGGAGRDS